MLINILCGAALILCGYTLYEVGHVKGWQEGFTEALELCIDESAEDEGEPMIGSGEDNHG